MFHCRVCTEQIETCEKQLRIDGESLEDRIGEVQAYFDVIARARRLIGLEQRNKIANEQRGVHRVRVAREGKHLEVVKGALAVPDAISKLRAEMPACQYRARFMQ